jgi:hypothetical protein
MLLTIQILHTIIGAAIFASLFHIIVCHIRDREGFWLKVSYIIVAIEAAAIIPCNFNCPISLFVAHVYSETADDILLPKVMAGWLIPIGIGLFYFGIAIKVGRMIAARQRRQQAEPPAS